MPTRIIGRRRELFVDDWLIDTFGGATLRLHHPVRQNVALAFDAPWEGPLSHYATLMHVDGECRLYYRGQSTIVRNGSAGALAAVTAVAISRDGIAWQRPTLGIVEWRGSRANNIVFAGEGAHNFTPFLDTNPAAPASERFKAIASVRFEGAPRNRGLVAFASPDGYHWHSWGDGPLITDGAFDSQNLAFWDAERGRYVCFFRHFREHAGQRYRSIKHATSPDFRHWSAPEWLDFGDTPLEHLYTNATVPYQRAPHLFLAFPKRFLPDRRRDPNRPTTGLSDGVLMSSRDGVRWDRRFMEAFLRPGRDLENWGDRTNGIAWGLLHTAPDELSLYWVEHYRHPTCRLRRGTVRLDGFASLTAGYGGGEALTHPLLFEGDDLVLNFATSAAGSIRVEVQDAEGHPLPGYALEDCPEMYGDELDYPVCWRERASLSGLAGHPIRLRLVLRDADLFSLRFRPGAA